VTAFLHANLVVVHAPALLPYELARHLGRHSAYYAAYIALAERMGVELWTLDGRLAANAESVGLPVHIVS
jgi:predicted nucleic acid-binding protein